jgi:hypothetical protein
MILPSEYAWFEPVFFAALILLGINFLGSLLVFSRRPALNALASALLFAFIFGGLIYYGYGRVEMRVSTVPDPDAPAVALQTATPPPWEARVPP